MNGAEIMDQMDRMTMGWWRPSPGSIYPLLEELEKEKLVTKGADGRYQLTTEAQGGPDWMRGMNFPGFSGPRTPEDAVQALDSYVRYLEDVLQTERSRIASIRDSLVAVSQRLDKVVRDAGSSS